MPGKIRVPIRWSEPPAPEDADAIPAMGPFVTVQDPTDWREVAARLQADMESYRLRQQKLVAERVLTEKVAFLGDFLPILDALENVLRHLSATAPERQGIQVTYDEMLRLLRRYEVVPIVALGAPFDPQLHEAVAVLPAPPEQEADMLVAEEILRGYCLGERLLRPARVVVAQKQELALARLPQAA